jgi:hypothetical protein
LLLNRLLKENKEIMKNISFFFLFSIIQMACGSTISEPSTFEGSWQLYKISYGFPRANGPTFTTEVEDIVYVFDNSKKTFSVFKKGKVSESGKFKLTADPNNPNGKEIIQFLSDNTYSSYTFSADYKELTLYQRAGIGGILADGSEFHYKKVE